MEKQFDENAHIAIEKLNSFGIASDNIVTLIRTDLSKPFTYGQTTVFALSDSLCVLNDDGSLYLKKYNEITDFYAENYVSSGEMIKMGSFQ